MTHAVQLQRRTRFSSHLARVGPTAKPCFDTLGDVIAKKAIGQSYEEYVQEHILTPLGMKDSTFLLSDVDPAALVRSAHLRRERQCRARRNSTRTCASMDPSATLFSSVSDMARFAIANMNHGELDGVRVLPSYSL